MEIVAFLLAFALSFIEFAKSTNITLLTSYTQSMLPPNSSADVVFFMGDFLGKTVEEVQQNFSINLTALSNRIVVVGRNWSSISINGTTSESQFFEFDVGLVKFLVVSTQLFQSKNDSKNFAQKSFLHQKLTAANEGRQTSSPWLIIVGAEPYYCGAKSRDGCNNYLRDGLWELVELANEFGVDLGLWAVAERYERLFPVYGRKVFWSHAQPVDDAFKNPPATAHVITGSHTNSTLPWSRIPWSGVSTGRGQSPGFVRLMVANSSHLYIEHIIRRNNINDDSVWLVRMNHSRFTADERGRRSGLTIPHEMCFHFSQC